MNRLEHIRVVPLNDALGAEISGIDFSENIPDEIKLLLVSLWMKHLVLLFRDQKLTELQHLKAAKIFGELQISAAKAYTNDSLSNNNTNVVRYNEISVVHNLNSDGLPTKDTESLGSGEVYWHSDNSYISCPPSGSMLYSKKIPPIGGNTHFSNQYLAYDNLPNKIKNNIASLTAVHDSSRDGANVLRSGVKLPTKLSEVPGPHHPLARTHPITKKNSLYLGRRRAFPSQYIDGLSKSKSETLLDFLWNHAIKKEFCWEHKWKKNDLILWDNRCTMHYRDKFSQDQPRVLHRILIKGDKPYFENTN